MKIKWNITCAVPASTLERRRRINGKKGYPPIPRGEGILAVAGNGPSLLENLDELRYYGEIWAINSAANTLLANGINDFAMFSMDPMPIIATYAAISPRSIVCDHAHPEVFRRAQNLSMFRMDGLIQGSTTATAAPELGLTAGYEHICFFGCEGSFKDGQTHANQDVPGHRLDVKCGGKVYETSPQMMIQTEALAPIFEEKKYFSERSGGLLRAMATHGDYDIIAADEEFAKGIKECQLPS